MLNSERRKRILQQLLRDGEVTVLQLDARLNTSTTTVRRDLAELFREMTFSNGVFLLTGTSNVPPDDFTLHPGDQVSITIEGIGTLENPVE